MKNKSFLQSLSCAAKGIVTSLKTERNFRFDCVMALFAAVCSFIFSLDKWEKCVVFCLCALVLVSEEINTAIESAVDLAEPKFNPLAGRAKDISAAAPLIASLAALFIGLYIFVPHIIEFFKGVFM